MYTADFAQAISVLSLVSESYDDQNKLVFVIDGANKLYGEVNAQGTVDAPLLNTICTKLSPHAIIILLCSGSTVLDKAPKGKPNSNLLPSKVV
jgi:hypothetical protein